MARPLKPLVRGGGYYPSNKWTPLVYPGGYTTANGGGQPEPEAVLKTVTGSLIHITDALALPAEALSVNVEPIQDLHGYDSPWPAGGGNSVIDFESIFSEGWTNENGGLKATYSKGYITVTGTNNTSGWINIVSYTGQWYNDPLTLPAGTYSTADHINISCSIDGGSYGNKSGTITANTSVEIRGFYIAVNTGQTVNWKVPMVVAKGSTVPTTFFPYSNICPISGRTSATVTRTGKNLLDVSNATHSAYNIGSIPNTLCPNTEYTYSINGTTTSRYRLYLAKSSAPLNAVIPLSNSYDTSGGHETFTTPANMSEYDALVLAGDSSAAGSVPLSDILPQIELGSTASPYEPYQGDTYTIQLGDTIYGGTLDVTGGKMVVDRAMYTFDGTEPFVYTTNQQVEVFNYFRWYSSDFKLRLSNWNVLNDAIMTCYPVTNKLNYWYSGGVGNDSVAWTVKNNAGLCIRDDRYATANELKAALVGQAMVYTLATPIEVTLTPTQIDMLLGENNLWSDAGDSTLTYYAEGEASTSEALGILLGGTYNNPGGADDASDDEALGILLGGS